MKIDTTKMAASYKALLSRLVVRNAKIDAAFAVNCSKRCLGNESNEDYDPAYKYNSEFFRRHSLASIAARRRLLGLDPNLPDTFVPFDTEIEESTDEWRFVERLIPMITIPVPPPPYPTPTGWRPPAEVPPDLPYFVRRNRNHLFNVYYDISKDLTKRSTTLKYIEGDIWTLENDLRCHLEERLSNGKSIFTQVNEAAGNIRFKSQDFTKDIVDWLMRIGF